MKTQAVMFSIVALAAINNLSSGQNVPVARDVDVKLIPKVDSLVALNKSNPATYPLLAYQGRAFVAYDHVDNRNGLTIVAFDDRERPLKRWERKGTRGLRRITVDRQKRTVSFWGQDNKAVRMSWKELVVRDNGVATRVNDNDARHSTRDIARETPFPSFDEIDFGLQGMPGMRREWQKLQQELAWQSEQATTEAALQRENLARRLRKRVTIDKEEVESLMMDIMEVDMLSAASALGEGFAGGENPEQRVQQSLGSSNQLILQLRAKVASDLFIGSPIDRQELLRQLDEIIRLRKQQTR